MEQPMSEIEFPWLRFQLVENLKALSDVDYQVREWINRSPEDNPEFDEMDYIIHFLYDDTELAENPYDAVGSILLNKNEADTLKSLSTCLDNIFSKYGTDLNGPEYIKLPEWIHVVECARIALSEIH
jgi:hypothetical protein